MNLDTNTKVMRIVLGEAMTTSNCDIVSAFADYLSGAFTLVENSVHSTGTTPVVVVPAPATDAGRQVKEIRLFNNDTVTHNVTLQLYDGTTVWVVGPEASVPSGGTFIYTPSGGTTVTNPLVTVTDGTNTVANVTQITFADATVSGTSPNATVTPLIQSITVSLTKAQIEASGASPMTIVPAPGSGKWIITLGTVYDYTFGTAAFSGGPQGLSYGAASGPQADKGDSSVGTQTASAQAASAGVIGGAFGAALNTAVVNQPVVYTANTGAGQAAYTGASPTGTLKITVLYAVLPV